MRDLLTPKQVARAIDVSESSIKRWCDKGVIPTQYTAGGHRRITMPALIEFLRSGKYELVNPEALGLPAASGQSVRVIDRAKDQLTEALLSGDEERCRQIAVDLYLAEYSVSRICDDVVAYAFRQIGDRWACGEAEVYEERRGCEIALRVLHDFRSLLPSPPNGAPLAIGGTPAGDQYSLGTTMAELVLTDNQWNASSLGSNLPFPTLAAALRKHKPQLVWLSCSHLDNPAQFVRDYGEFYEEFGMDVAIVVGGYALTEDLRQRMKYAAYCDTMQHLESFGQTLRDAVQKTVK